MQPSCICTLHMLQIQEVSGKSGGQLTRRHLRSSDPNQLENGTQCLWAPTADVRWTSPTFALPSHCRRARIHSVLSGQERVCLQDHRNTKIRNCTGRGGRRPPLMRAPPRREGEPAHRALSGRVVCLFVFVCVFVCVRRVGASCVGRPICVCVVSAPLRGAC
jgi:hypothetical protein